MNRPRKYDGSDYPMYRRVMGIYRAAEQRSKKKGLSFDLTPEWLLEKFKNGKCEITGLSFDFERKKYPLSPSLDRIDNSKGYTKDNCRLIIWWINSAKGTMSDLDLWHFCSLAVESLPVSLAQNAGNKEMTTREII